MSCQVSHPDRFNIIKLLNLTGEKIPVRKIILIYLKKLSNLISFFNTFVELIFKAVKCIITLNYLMITL